MKQKLPKICLIIGLIFGGLAVINGAELLSQALRTRVYAATGQKIVTIYDKQRKQTVLTEQKTVAEVLKQAGITLDKFDLVEPSLDTEVSDGFNVNIFRARPLTVIDGERQIKILTPYQLASDIARVAGLALYPEDRVEFQLDMLGLGSGLGSQMVIRRATEFNLVFFGKKSVVRSHQATVGDFLKQRRLTLGTNDRMNLGTTEPLRAGMTLEIWQEGQQQLAVEEDVPFKTRQVLNYEKPAGFRQIQQAGVVGKRSVTYQVEIKNGKEISRRELQSVVVKEPVEQIEIVGAKRSSGGLTQSKGVFQFVDSKGVQHRETYYDLPMSVVMRNCGQGGKYTVREDGVKVDSAGYVIIAAHLGNYPRCSVVETSLGPGKVYDTGGFTAKHPHGFDLATDWTNRDGR